MKSNVVLIVSYNRASILKIALRHLNNSSKRRSFDVIVVDNGSTDETMKIAKSFKSIKYRKENKNLFVSKALNNAFFKQKLYNRYKYVLIMANDVLVEGRTVTNLINFMNTHPNVGVSGPKHFDIDVGTLLNEGLTINPITSLLKNCDPVNSKSGINHFHSCFIVRTDAFKKVGGFNDLLFPMIYEEPDLGNRILEAGYEIAPCRSARIWHPIEIGDRKKQDKAVYIRKDRLYNSIPKAYLFFRNRIIYMSLHSNSLQFLIFFIAFLPITFIYYLPSIESKYLKYVFYGILDGSMYALTRDNSYIRRRNKSLLHI